MSDNLNNPDNPDNVTAEQHEKADLLQDHVNKQEAIAQSRYSEYEKCKSEADAEIKKVMPQYEKAVKKVSDLKTRDVDDVRNMRAASSAVLLAMTAASILLKPKMNFRLVKKAGQISYWDTAQKHFLNKPQLLIDTLLAFDPTTVSAKTVRDMSSIIKNSSFTPAAYDKNSRLARALCVWSHSVMIVAHVCMNIQSLRVRQSNAESQHEDQKINVSRFQDKNKRLKLHVKKLDEAHDSLKDKLTELNNALISDRVKLERCLAIVAILDPVTPPLSHIPSLSYHN